MGKTNTKTLVTWTSLSKFSAACAHADLYKQILEQIWVSPFITSLPKIIQNNNKNNYPWFMNLSVMRPLVAMCLERPTLLSCESVYIQVSFNISPCTATLLHQVKKCIRTTMVTAIRDPSPPPEFPNTFLNSLMPHHYSPPAV